MADVAEKPANQQVASPDQAAKAKLQADSTPLTVVPGGDQYGFIGRINDNDSFRNAVLKSHMLQNIVEDIANNGYGKTVNIVYTDDLKKAPRNIKLVESTSPEFNPNHGGTILIESYKTKGLQIEALAHEGFHAGHQDIKFLFDRSQPVPLRTFINLKMTREAQSFYIEVLVANELHLSGQPSYEWVDPQSQKTFRTHIADMIIDKPTEKQKLQAIAEFLWTHDSVQRVNGEIKVVNGKVQLNSYRQLQLDDYKLYTNLKDYFYPNRTRIFPKWPNPLAPHVSGLPGPVHWYTGPGYEGYPGTQNIHSGGPNDNLNRSSQPRIIYRPFTQRYFPGPPYIQGLNSDEAQNMVDVLHTVPQP